MRAAVLRRPGLIVLTLIGIPYFATTIVASARRHLWNDELYTYYFARLPSLTDVWKQLETGVEQTPPLFYVVTRASLFVFGNGSVAIRLPEIVGVFVACCAIYKVVERRTSVIGGTTAALIVLSTEPLTYAYEARPYGLVLGLAAVALLLWQLRSEGGGTLIVVGLAATLMCAVSVHYYAALLVVPLGAAELVRTTARRRLDGGIVAALVAGLAPLIAYEPLIRGADKYAGKFWTTFSWDSAATFYAWLVRSPAVPPRIGTWTLVAFVAVVVVVALAVCLRRPVAAAGELAAAIGFLALPLVAVAGAKIETGAFTERYTLSAVLGLAVLVPLAVHRLGDQLRFVPPVVALGLAVFFLRACVYDVHDVNVDRTIQSETIAFLDRSDPRLPIVAAHSHDYLELQRYGDPKLKARLIYLVNSRLSRRYLGSTSTDDGLVVMSRFAPLDVRPYSAFVQSHRPFLVFVNPGAGQLFWLTRALRADHVGLRRVSEDNGRVLYAVR